MGCKYLKRKGFKEWIELSEEKEKDETKRENLQKALLDKYEKVHLELPPLNHGGR